MKRLVLFVFLFPWVGSAEEVQMKAWTNESELSVVSVTGNSESESVSVRQKSSYQFDQNVFAVSGRYLNTKSLDQTTKITQDTSRIWEAALRYDRLVGEDWSVYLGVSAESNPFGGYIQKDNSEIGGKYIFAKDRWTGEFGYRNTKTYDTKGNRSTTHYGRLYTEYSQSFNPTSSFRMSVEYLPNFTDRTADAVNAEPSLTVILSSILSLKMAYSWKFNAGNQAPLKTADAQLTTALVAKY